MSWVMNLERELRDIEDYLLMDGKSVGLRDGVCCVGPFAIARVG
jgi:hypothetical protein